MNEDEIRRLVLQQSIALRKRDREHILQQAQLTGDNAMLEQLAQKMLLARQEELRAFAAQLDAQNQTQAAAQAAQQDRTQQAGRLFDLASQNVAQGDRGAAINRLEMANTIAPHENTQQAIDALRARRSVRLGTSQREE